jgi:hypothetical protein
VAEVREQRTGGFVAVRDVLGEAAIEQGHEVFIGGGQELAKRRWGLVDDVVDDLSE